MKEGQIILEALNTLTEEFDFKLSIITKAFILAIDPISVNNSEKKLKDEDMIVFSSELKSEIIRISKKLKSELNIDIQVRILDSYMIRMYMSILKEPKPITNVDFDEFLNKNVILQLYIPINPDQAKVCSLTIDTEPSFTIE